MPGLSHPDWVKSRAKSLWLDGMPYRAIAQVLKFEFDSTASASTVWGWAQAWKGAEKNESSGGTAA